VKLYFQISEGNLKPKYFEDEIKNAIAFSEF